MIYCIENAFRIQLSNAVWNQHVLISHTPQLLQLNFVMLTCLGELAPNPLALPETCRTQHQHGLGQEPNLVPKAMAKHGGTAHMYKNIYLYINIYGHSSYNVAGSYIFLGALGLWTDKSTTETLLILWSINFLAIRIINASTLVRFLYMREVLIGTTGLL